MNYSDNNFNSDKDHRSDVQRVKTAPAAREMPVQRF